jgi:drug/metabolite transporter (DMT)-like permease
VTAGTTVAGALGLALLAALGDDWTSLARLSAMQWGALLYLALGCSVLAYLAYNRALAEVEASRAAAWLYLEPVVAVVLGAALLGEGVAPQTVVGGAIIVGALAVAGRG